MPSLLLAGLLAAIIGRHAVAEELASSMPALRPQGLLTVRSLRVASTATEGSNLYFGAETEYAMGANPEGSFVVKHAGKPQPLMLLDKKDSLILNTQTVNAMSVNSAAGFALRGVPQWQLVSSEDFSQKPLGWSRQEVSACAGVHMLGGPCHFSRTQVNKTFGNLPRHKQLRVVATFHFIDRWIGESGFMKLSTDKDSWPVVVWSEQHVQQESKNGISLCGQSSTPEGKFSVPIDVVVPHTQDSVNVEFGSTMDDADPCDESWGISGFEVYARA